jgi:hypothetical protein
MEDVKDLNRNGSLIVLETVWERGANRIFKKFKFFYFAKI